MKLNQLKQEFENHLGHQSQLYFPGTLKINRAITYTLLSPGKRLRPLLCLSFAELFNADKNLALRCGTAVEMIHAYSLIHDDLPAMDNDQMRRGIPTNHMVFGEAHAILAGDALLTFAPQMLMEELLDYKMDPLLIIRLTNLLLEASGQQGMVMGQALDIEHEREQDIEMATDLELIHSHKTGKIMAWCCLAGLYCSQNLELIDKAGQSVVQIGEKIGLAFQIIDDILDEQQSSEVLGKTNGKDKVQGKLTFPLIYGIEKSEKMAFDLLELAKQELSLISLSENGLSLVFEILEQFKVKLLSHQK